GDEADVEGRWVPRPGRGGRPEGTLVIGLVGRVGSAPGMADRLRNRLGEGGEALYGSRAGMVSALVLGGRGGITPELQDRFGESGLVHLLSISGFHVGLITAWVYLLARLLRLRRTPALAGAAGVGAVYVAFLGWPAPAARAAALALLAARSRIAQRQVQPDALLAATCLGVLLLDPWAILDLGGWLSVAALWGASRFTRWSDHALRPDFWCRTGASSLGATLATAPLTAGSLGSVAPIGIGLNFLAIPIAAVAVPGVLASLLLFPVWRGAADGLAAGAGLCLHLLELLAVAGAAVPGGHVVTDPGLAAAAPWIVALTLALWATGTRNTALVAGRRAGWAVTLGLWTGLVPILPWSGDEGNDLALHFLDVGQGDGAVVRTPRGRWVVIDAGPASDRSDAGARVVAPFLERHGARSVAAVVISHAHLDHIGGIPSLLDRFPVGEVLEPGAPVSDPLYTGFLTALVRRHIAWHPVHRGESFTLDGVRFTVLHPEPNWSGWGDDVNEDSVVLLVEYGAFQALFAGDAGFPAEEDLRARVGRVDVLKVGHHGSRGSTSDPWLDELRPRLAVISVGRNDYGHPARPTLDRLAAHGIPVRRTDQEGTITVSTDGEQMRVRTARSSLEVDVR
ncbi:MAG TPA: DNA internalization-related competence protein ComEC/Rec2, partial [Gemmatimonadales bacterium]|nr:DNA internalization-related competence protein ComEC/Rec2 [Gemmatimonadales bacterium]